jgi:hypothetical protein
MTSITRHRPFDHENGTPPRLTSSRRYNFMEAQIEDAHPGRDSAATQGRTPQIAIALLSVIGTVVVAFIGVLPQLRNKDVTIGDLQKEVAQLKTQANLFDDSKGREAAAPAKRLFISGNVMDLTGNRPLGSTDVYLIPLNSPKLIAKTNADGSFIFRDMPDERYWIVVRDSATGTSSAGLIDEDNSEARFSGALIKYHVEK